jgi:predicted outer membrane repeat protein
MNVYIGFNSSTSGGSCADPDYTVDGSDDSTAIDGAANDTAAGGTLHFCPGTYDVNATIVLTGKDITLSGASATTTILDGRATWTSGAYVSGGVQILYSGDDVVIHNLTFRHGFATSGGAIEAYTATVTSSIFTNNRADSEGGAISASFATVTSSTFTNNRATFGGAISGYDTATVTSSTFTNNSADFDGGAITAEFVIATSSTFTGNRATFGGAISGYDTAAVTSSTFTNNSADFDGGAVITYNGIIARSRFTRNTAGEHGGAVALWDQNSDDLQQVRGNTFRGNTASAGGAITLRSCETTYTRSQVRSVERANRFSGNRATQQRRTNNVELWVDDCAG